MYRCDLCQETSQPGEMLARIVTIRRERIYRYPGGLVTRGHEIAAEAAVHPGCAEKLPDPAVIPLSAADRAAWVAANAVAFESVAPEPEPAA